MFSTLRCDVQVAWRQLIRRPAHSALIVLVLALALGGVSAVYSVVQAVLLMPLPYGDSSRLVHVGHGHSTRGAVYGAFSPQDAQDLSARTPSVAQLAWYLYMPNQTSVNTRAGDRREQLEAAYVSAEFFNVLSMAPVHGRTLGAVDLEPGVQTVVLSQRAWQQQFGGDPALVGRDIAINDQPYRVVGVMPAEFDYPSVAVQAWLPLSAVTETMIPHRRDVRWLDMVGALKPGVDLAAAGRELGAVIGALAREHPDSNAGFERAVLEPLVERVVGHDRGPLWAIFAATVLVLLTACVNLANLLLARATERERELALKGAIGAAPGRIARQVTLEIVLLTTLGAVAGLLLAKAALAWFADAGAGQVARLSEVRLDPGVIAFGFAASLATALACALLPARHARRVDPARALGNGVAGTARAGVGRTRTALMVVQVALVCVLAYGTLLVLRSVQRLADVDLGVSAERVLSFNVRLQGPRYEPADAIGRDREAILDALRTLPGVTSVAASKNAPIGETGERYGFTLPEAPQTLISPEWGTLFVTRDYFRTLGIPMVRGQTFDAGERRGEPSREVIVNQAFAARHLPGRDPVGQALRIGTAGPEVRIVGLVGDVRHAGPRAAAQPTVYVSHASASRSSVTVSLRVAGEVPELMSRVREAVWSVNPDLPIVGMDWLGGRIDRLNAQPRLLSALLSGFAALSAAIGGIGVFGLLSYVVGARRREFALKLALGERPVRLMRGVLGQGAAYALTGLVLGAAMGLAAARALRTVLFDTQPFEPEVLAMMAGGMMLLALCASALPAWRALRISPMQVLRED